MKSERYDAYFVPGLNQDDVDDDEMLALGIRWLGSTALPGPPVIVLHAKKMWNNRRTLAAAASRYEVVSPQSDRPAGRGPRAVLAVWPSAASLQFAEQLARDGALCVVPGSLYDVSGWLARTRARNLHDPSEQPQDLPEVADEVKAAIASICRFGGHNRFIGGADKEDAVRRLRTMVHDGHRPPPALVEQLAIATGDTDPKGAARLRQYYEGVLEGRGFRDSAGRLI